MFFKLCAQKTPLGHSGGAGVKRGYLSTIAESWDSNPLQCFFSIQTQLDVFWGREAVA